MDFKNPKFYLIVIITFVVVFLMNYLGNSNAPDQLESFNERSRWSNRHYHRSLDLEQK